MAAPLTSPRPPCWHWALCAEGTATLGGLLHLLGKGGPVAALEGELPPLQPQALAAALARAQTPALHPRQWARGLADGIAPLDLVKVSDRVPPALGLWMGQTPRQSLRAHPWVSTAQGSRRRREGERGEERQHPGTGSSSSQTPLRPQHPPCPTCTCKASSWAHKEVRGKEDFLAARVPQDTWAAGSGGLPVARGVEFWISQGFPLPPPQSLFEQKHLGHMDQGGPEEESATLRPAAPWSGGRTNMQRFGQELLPRGLFYKERPQPEGHLPQ